MAHDVFICHSSQDKSVADAACAALERADIACWIAPRNPVAGIPYGRQIIDAIERARALLLIFSEQANRSEHVARELEIAANAKKPIVPLRIEAVMPSGDLQYYVMRVHWLDATAPPMETRLSELVAAVQQVLDATPRHNLPVQLTSLIGRDEELAGIAALLERSRLVTLTGAGGIGKTCASLQVAANLLRRFGDGVWFIELAPLTRGDYLPSTVAQALGIKLPADSDPVEHLVRALKGKQTLLLFDNCEHLIDETRSVASAILYGCPEVRIVATSSKGLNNTAEEEYRMPSLARRRLIIITIAALILLAKLLSTATFADSVGTTGMIEKMDEAVLARVCQSSRIGADEMSVTSFKAKNMSYAVRCYSINGQLYSCVMRTSLHVHRALHAAFAYGVSEERALGENVVSRVKAPRPDDRAPAPVSRDHVCAIIAAANGTRLDVPLVLATTTGLRRGELLALRWSDVDFDRASLRVTQALEHTRSHGVRFKSPKSRSSRRLVPLAAECVELLRTHKATQDAVRAREYADNDLVLPNPDGTPWPPDSFSVEFGKLARAAGCRGFRFHDLRHTFATFSPSSGGSIKDVQALLGHSSATLTLSTYAHVLEGAGRAVVNRLGSSLLDPEVAGIG